MLLDNITNIKVEDKSITIELVGIVGFEIDSENLANQINEAKANGVENVKIILESPGGNMAQGLSIYSILKNSGLKVESYLRGANASASTLIASAANKENIYMDETGLYLIHKPMMYSEGNENDFENSKNSLKKWENSLRKIYQNLGVANETLDDLLNRNNGHGEWLNFEEAQELGFVGQAWQTEAVFNFDKEFFNKHNLITPKNKDMEENKEVVEEKSLLTKIWNKLNAEPKQEIEEEEMVETAKNMLSDEEKTSIVAELMQIIEPRLVALEEALNPDENVEEEEEEVENKENDEKYNALLNEFKNLKKEISNGKPEKTNKVENLEDAPFWKQRINGIK